MQQIKEAAAEFLAGRRIAVTGVSRHPESHGSNVVYRRLRDRGYEVFAVNPNADEVEGDRAYDALADIPVSVNTIRITRCPGSAVGPNMHGQPPSMTVIPCCLPHAAASADTLPPPGPRCIHTWVMPRSAHSRTVASAASGRVPITPPSTLPGMSARASYARSPSTSSALGLTANTS